MEVHAVLPEERAQDENGNFLPWGYRHLDSALNPRSAPEESGPFGRNRSNRYAGSRSRTRTGTTPVRQKENASVAEFGRILSREQKKEEERGAKANLLGSTNETPKPLPAQEAVATECLIYGYASKNSECKVLSKFERIVAPSYICEDYPREDSDLSLGSSRISNYSMTAHRNLTQDALRKSRVYRGGNHWIKLTFDNYNAADRACHFSPQEIEGHLVFCELWQNRPPFSDAPLLQGSHSAREHQRNADNKIRTLTTAQTSTFQSGLDSAVAGFERATQTLPRSFAAPESQYSKPIPTSHDDSLLAKPSSQSSATASSATATATGAEPPPGLNALRSRSTPFLPTTPRPPSSPSEFMTHIPSVKRAVYKPVLLPERSFSQRLTKIIFDLLAYIPVISWLITGISRVVSGPVIGEGPVLDDRGGFSGAENSWYWAFWSWIDLWAGTDFCGLRED